MISIISGIWSDYKANFFSTQQAFLLVLNPQESFIDHKIILDKIEYISLTMGLFKKENDVMNEGGLQIISLIKYMPSTFFFF